MQNFSKSVMVKASVAVLLLISFVISSAFFLGHYINFESSSFRVEKTAVSIHEAYEERNALVKTLIVKVEESDSIRNFQKITIQKIEHSFYKVASAQNFAELTFEENKIGVDAYLLTKITEKEHNIKEDKEWLSLLGRLNQSDTKIMFLQKHYNSLVKAYNHKIDEHSTMAEFMKFKKMADIQVFSPSRDSHGLLYEKLIKKFDKPVVKTVVAVVRQSNRITAIVSHSTKAPSFFEHAS